MPQSRLELHRDLLVWFDPTAELTLTLTLTTTPTPTPTPTLTLTLTLTLTRFDPTAAPGGSAQGTLALLPTTSVEAHAI